MSPVEQDSIDCQYLAYFMPKKIVKEILCNFLVQTLQYFIDRHARRSGPTIHFVGLTTLVQNMLSIHGNLMFDKRQLKKAYKTLKIGSDWIKSDWIGSESFGLDQNRSDWKR